MDDDGLSLGDSPMDPSDSAGELAQASLQSYINSVPYECEAPEVMQARLEEIVGKISICAKSQNWLVLTTWDGMLQCWMLMRYPIPKETRAKLGRLYFELCLIPGVETRVIRSWTDMLHRLISTKDAMKRKLEATDLRLPWEPLWAALKTHLWHKGKIHDPSRTMITLLIYLAEQSSRYFAPEDIPKMLDAFIPLLTRETYAVIIPVITAFLPPTHTHLYLPFVFKFWESINSSLVDDRFLLLAAQLSEEHVAGPTSVAGLEGGAQWKDVGIWSEIEWDFLVTKGLGSMNVPVGASRGSSTTAHHADSLGDRHGYKVKKTVDRYLSLAKVFAYSLSEDGSVRTSHQHGTATPGLAGGSKALNSLERLLTSTESFFHPSNSGPWTVALTSFLYRLVSEFAKRVESERLGDCLTPVTRRITKAIKREFVTLLRTPALLSLFSKDPLCVGYAQGALRGMALLEPTLIMPDLLERAYSGLEVVNETHRTTAVLTMLSGIARPLVTERIWLGGQKNLLPLLELSLPGIDLNDPSKTVCTTMFIVSAIQHVKIGDLSMHQSGVPLTDDVPDDAMAVDEDIHLPLGTESEMPVLSRADERALARDSTAAFADWVLALFQRVISLYENLPEEGGRRNTTGGKQEESVLKSVKAMMDVICLHLSDQLFELVLNMVFNYASTNAKSNAVRAIAQLVACLARVRPEQTLAKFLPFCMMQIEEELKHGASSVRTTAPGTAIPSDTTFHWNLGILRGCLGYGGPLVVKYKDQVMQLLTILIDKAKGERGYSGTGRLLGRLAHTLTGVYPTNSQFVNGDEWAKKEFDSDHNLHWGRMYTVNDATIDWHVPSDGEVALVLEILDKVASPLLDKVEALTARANSWDSVDRNDFCRYLNACRSLWGGLSTFVQEQPKTVPNPCINPDTECHDLLVTQLIVNAGFVLTDTSDPRYVKASAHRIRFGQVSQRASAALRAKTEGEDHTDAVLLTIKAMDTYLLDYGLSKDGFESTQKTFTQARDSNRLWAGQKENTRSVFVKRAQMYHSGRVYMHALYRRRSALDDELIGEVLQLSLSPYTKVRRQSQAVLHNAFGYFVRSTRFALPTLFDALAKGTDPDRMKGALYILWSKGIASYALSDQSAHGRYLTSLLECQHEEKPSIQKLVGNMAADSVGHLHDESVHTEAYTLETPRVEVAVDDLAEEFTSSLMDPTLLAEAIAKTPNRIVNRNAIHGQTVAHILALASNPQTHWRYVQMACRFLVAMIRRDVAVTPELVSFFMKHSTSPQPSIAAEARRGLSHSLSYIKFRSFASTKSDLWMHTWTNPLTVEVPVSNPLTFVEIFDATEGPLSEVFIDKVRTGFLAWTPTVKGYRRPDDTFEFQWEDSSKEVLASIQASLGTEDYFKDLLFLWSQESNRSGSIELRGDHVGYIKRFAKMFSIDVLRPLLTMIEPMLSDADKFKQRAGGEVLSGVVRGSKHWPPSASRELWAWVRQRIDQVYSEIKPDTIQFWETAILHLLDDRDPRRNKPLVDWVLSLPLDFHGDSAFEMNKSLSTLSTLAEAGDYGLGSKADSYVQLLLSNANTSFAETRMLITQNLSSLIYSQWRPIYSSVAELLRAVETVDDPLFVRRAKHRSLVTSTLEKLGELRDQRLPPPYTNKSEYDKIALTLLQWGWVSSHSPNASSVLPYLVDMMPEVFRMTEFNDNNELQTYSTVVLYVVSAFTPPVEFISIILNQFVAAIQSSTSWRMRLQGLPALVVFFYRNLLSISPDGVEKVMEMLLTCLSDENVEVREMASKALSGVVRCSQRQNIIPLKERFVKTVRRTKLPNRKDDPETYADKLRTLHSAMLGICALIESFPYSVEPWMPSLTDVLAAHATDPVPVSTTIRKCASEFKKTHQDTWHRDQLLFNEDQLQSLSTMLVGTSYYA